MESNFIRAYGGVFSSSLCDNLIETYEKLWREKEEQLKKISLCYTEDGVKTCGACNCQRLDIMQHQEFKEPFNIVMNGIQTVLNQYKIDSQLHSCQWPKEHGYEHLRIKRYRRVFVMKDMNIIQERQIQMYMNESLFQRKLEIKTH